MEENLVKIEDTHGRELFRWDDASAVKYGSFWKIGDVVVFSHDKEKELPFPGDNDRYCVVSVNLDERKNMCSYVVEFVDGFFRRWLNRYLQRLVWFLEGLITWRKIEERR